MNETLMCVTFLLAIGGFVMGGVAMILAFLSHKMHSVNLECWQDHLKEGHDENNRPNTSRT